MGSTSIWQAEATQETAMDFRWPALKANIEADVVVIGAGITGLSAALFLARGGARVVILEARDVAAGASGRNGGFLLSGTSESYAAAIEHLGRERARRVWAFSAANHVMVRELIAELADVGMDCSYQQVGSLRIATSDEEMSELVASVALLREDGWRADLAERVELPAHLGEHGYYGGIFYPDDAEVHPARYVRGIARLAVAAGASIYGESPVTALRFADDGWLAQTPSGSVRCSTLLLATNAWTGELGPRLGQLDLARLIVPQRGQMLATDPVEARLFFCPCYADEGYQYWRQRQDGRLVIGGWRNTSFATEAVLDETPGDVVQGHMDRFLRETLGLSDVRVAHRWAGVMAFSPDGLPLVGGIPGVERAYIAAGYTGHGNAMAVRSARMLADIIIRGRADDEDLFAPARFDAAM